MKNMIKPILATALLMISVNIAHAQVANIAPETFAQYGKDEAYFIAEVSCAQGGSLRSIQRKTDGDEWCGKAVAGFCSENKDEAAKKVCSSDYGVAATEVENQAKAKAKAKQEAADAKARAVAAEQEQADARRAAEQRIAKEEAERLQKAQAVVAAAPVERKISIEEELIQIEQEKLELQQQELELRRRAAEIEKALETDGVN